LKHVEDPVQHNLLGGLDIIVNVFHDEEQAQLVLLLKIFLNMLNHLNRVILGHTLQLQRLAEAHKDLALTVIEDRVDPNHLEYLLLLLLPLLVLKFDVLFDLVHKGMDRLFVS
jgi:hypothetical protein